MKSIATRTLVVLTILLLSFKSENKTAQWLRYPTISPDGKTILFCYKGDIYKVSSNGGDASVITLSDSYDFNPVWSPDGKSFAFASDRNGNFDVYLTSLETGNTERLTYYSTSDIPYAFTPDGKQVIFASSRMDDSKYTQFPSWGMGELYTVSIKGGREKMFLSIPVNDVSFNSKGNVMLFHDKKGYEDTWRKHHTSSVARDIWKYDLNTKSFTQLSNFNGEDRNPVYNTDDSKIYYLSEKSGSFNIWEMDANTSSSTKQITNFDKNPVRFLSISDNNMLCFGYNGAIYTQDAASGTNTKLNIHIATDDGKPTKELIAFSDGCTEMDISPNGKEVVFVVRGEVFVTSIEGNMTKRITNTPEQERNVSFSPDGKSILYAAERNNSWGIYKTDLARKDENHFFNSTVLKEEAIYVDPKVEAFQPAYSPDGKEVAFLENRTAVKVINLASKSVRTIMPEEKNYSYSDGDQSFEWSPDGKHILVHFLQDGNWRGEVGLASADGKTPITDLTQSGFDCSGARWFMKGNMVVWFSSRHGMKNVASHGSQSDAYGLFMNQDSYDRFVMNKEEYDLLKEEEKKKKPDAKAAKDKSDKEKKDTSSKVESIKIELDGIENRKVRLTIHSSDLADAIVTPDGEQLLYLARFEKGYDLWQTKFKDHETKLLLKLNANGVSSMKLDKDGKNIYMICNGRICKIGVDKGDKKDIGFKAEMNLDLASERAYLFEHVWRQVKRKFYVTDLQKTDWDYYKTNYSSFLGSINNNYDFAEMLSEMLGELNASHTGCRYRANSSHSEHTGSLGAFFDESYTGNGLKIAELVEKGPLIFNGCKIKAGHIIEKINGVEILPETNYYELLNSTTDKNTLLSMYDEKTKTRWEETVKPIDIGELGGLLYKRWIKRMQEMTDKLSGGQVAYMHVQGMNDESYRAFFDEVMGKYVNKKALVVDTRFNGGGWLHDDLATFLSGKKYIDFVPRGRKIGVEPAEKWNKPSAVLMGEGNYSDAHMFPVVYKTLGIGKLIGMPVPGTGTAVWWENLQDRSLVFGIPQVGVVDQQGNYYENHQLEPDIKVMNDYAKMLQGEDQQLEAAVKSLLGK